MKQLISSLMLAMSTLTASAQLTVYHNGNVNVGSEQPTSNVTFSVGDATYADSAYHVSSKRYPKRKYPLYGEKHHCGKEC